jgi:hypothetical protein
MDSGIAGRNEETVEFAEANGRGLTQRLEPLLFNYHKIERQTELTKSWINTIGSPKASSRLSFFLYHSISTILLQVSVSNQSGGTRSL